MINRIVFLVAVVGSCAVVGAQPPADHVTVPLTDPARPASLNLQLVRGGITVRGSNRLDVVVIGRARGPQNETAGATRPRQIVQSPGFTVTENHNEILFVLHSPERAIDFEIQVPSRTNLKLGTTDARAPIVVEGVEGELEINNPTGPITLNQVGGAIVASSVEGDVRATITSVSTQRPTALSSFNRDVDVTFPSSLKANLRLRSDQGKIFTDFDVAPVRLTAGPDARPDGGPIRVEVGRDVYGTVNGGGSDIELRTFKGNLYARRSQ